VTFDVSAPAPAMKSPMGPFSVSGASATAKISRKDFGLVWNKPLDKAGGMMVGDDVKIQIDVELDNKGGAAPMKK
jgi:polyisoprenoid-binding protein YceI